MSKQHFVDLITDFYGDFSTEKIAQLSNIYSDEVLFQDPFHEIRGLNNLSTYFDALAQNLSTCRFEFSERCVQEDKAFLCWQMHFSHPRIKSGNKQTVNGSSFLKFEEKIVYHRDYFDSAEMLYRHLPVFGRVIQFIEKRMAS